METKVDKIINLIDFSIQKIKEVCAVYGKFTKKIQWIGMSKMLHSMLDMEKDHEKQLKTLRQQGNLENVFNTASEITLPPDNFFAEINYRDNMNFTDFLSMVILQQEEFIRLYSYLGSRTVDQEIRHILTALTEDARKQRLWALDRYELEILTL